MSARNYCRYERNLYSSGILIWKALSVLKTVTPFFSSTETVQLRRESRVSQCRLRNSTSDCSHLFSAIYRHVSRRTENKFRCVSLGPYSLTDEQHILLLTSSSSLSQRFSRQNRRMVKRWIATSLAARLYARRNPDAHCVLFLHLRCASPAPSNASVPERECNVRRYGREIRQKNGRVHVCEIGGGR